MVAASDALGDDTGTRVHAWLAEDERPLTHRIDADWTRRADTGNAWSIGYVPRRHFGRRAYGFAETRLGGEAALGIDTEARALVGVGATLSPAPAARLFAEIGAGVVRTDLDDPCEDARTVAPGAPCFGAPAVEAETSGLGTLRAGASATLAERVGLSAAAGVEAREGATDLGASATASLAAPGGTASVTLRTRRLSRDGEDARSVTDTFVGYSLGF